MTESEVIVFLEKLYDRPNLVYTIGSDYIRTTFGDISIDCLGSCFKIIFSNDTSITVDITKKDKVQELYNNIIDRARFEEIQEVLNFINEDADSIASADYSWTD